MRLYPRRCKCIVWKHRDTGSWNVVHAGVGVIVMSVAVSHPMLSRRLGNRFGECASLLRRNSLRHVLGRDIVCMTEWVTPVNDMSG